MPIRIVFDEGEYRPTFFCDHCDRPIEPEHGEDGSGIGSYLFMNNAIGLFSIIDEVFVLHKECTDPFVVSLVVPPDTCAIQELDVLPLYLLANMGVSFKKAVEHAMLLAGLND